MAGLLAGRDRGAEDIGEAVGEVGHGLGQAGAFHDPRAQRDGQRALALVVILFRKCGEGFIDRQIGRDRVTAAREMASGGR